jgi:23S rRNA (uracil1939-C5)-methyltransferase
VSLPPFEATIDRIAAGTGDAVGKAPDGRTVFVDDGIPGDVVMVRPTEVHERWLRGKIGQLLTPSAAAIDPGCPVHERCGGCRFRRMAHADEWSAKVVAFHEAIRRLTRTFDWPAPTSFIDPVGDGYRRRANLRFSPSGSSGYLSEGSHEVVFNETCAALDPRLDAARDGIGTWLAKAGVVAAIFIEWDDVRGGVAVTIPQSETRFAGALRSGIPSQVVSARIDNYTTIFGDGRVHRAYRVAGTEVVVRELSGGFSQANGRLNPTLQRLVVESAAVGAGDEVLELFAGAGNLTFPLLTSGASVFAIEGEGGAIDALADALRSAGTAVAGRWSVDVRDLAHGLSRKVRDRKWSTVVVDPPRGGMSAPLCDVLATIDADRIVYVSCDPPAMARDALRLAEGGWRPTRLDFVDMFPRTAHIEAVCRFERMA